MKAFSIAIFLLLVGCNSASGPETTSIDPTFSPNSETGRWYSLEQVEKGKILFVETCATCHGANAESIKEWQVADVNRNYPAPPLNGTAHAWHHPLDVLVQVINQGGLALGGSMQAFEDKFSENEKLMLIASFQSYWNDNVYASWLTRENASRD